eukprot:CAMPEP_0172513090 /NCGR_PEP_ID=MMETSP1066-20121228/249602_1 /TAXON_ID=671091 /ORGANISM="Coscinodiscus wailesii, Strain CCMP2513" /LENGTH=520 /DNA_ID=CAMNT_0013293193 /DNA_START=225 /DNA_END=1784 /DNA_ORIENTATION=-
MSPDLSTALHFHGLHMKEEPYQDGQVAATQCTLPPYQNQTYEFVAREPGTHYWHLHSSLQRTDGAAGPLIINDPQDPLKDKYEEEEILFLVDWYHTSGLERRVGLDSVPFVWVGNPGVFLINGKGPIASDNVACNNEYGTKTYKFIEGKTYRLRIINGASLVAMNFAIGGHNLTIVEADGTIVNPVTVPNLDISPGQRYSVLLKAGSAGTYEMSTTMRARPPKETIQGLATVIIGDDANENVIKPIHPEWNNYEAPYGNTFEKTITTQTVPEDVKTKVLDAKPDLSYVVLGTQNARSSDGKLRWAVNNITQQFEKVPIITHVYNVAKKQGRWGNDTDLGGTYFDLPTEPGFSWNYTFEHNATNYPPGSKDVSNSGIPVIKAVKGQLIQIVLQNLRALNSVPELHSWHLHGHYFWQVGQGFGNYNPKIHDKDFNLVNPVRRDTLTIWPISWVAIRFIADNPGVWGFHCHMSSHLVMGMGIQIVTSPDMLPPPPDAATSCFANSLASAAEDVPTTSGGISNW